MGGEIDNVWLVSLERNVFTKQLYIYTCAECIYYSTGYCTITHSNDITRHQITDYKSTATSAGQLHQEEKTLELQA